MKMFYILAALLLTVSGCTRRDTEWKAESNLILSGQVIISENGTAASVTKASNQLPANTEVGVYVRTTATPAVNLNAAEWKNLPFLCDATGSIVLQGGTGVILTSGIKYDIFAYAPRVATATDANHIPVTHGMDVLWGQKTVEATPGSTRASLEFRHIGAQIGFKLKAKEGVTMDLTNAKFVASGFYKSGELDVETGQIIGIDRTLDLTDATGAKTIILATGDEMTVNVTVSVPGFSKPFGCPYKLTLKPGKSYIYTLTLNPDITDGIEFEIPDVQDWEDVESSGEVILK